MGKKGHRLGIENKNTIHASIHPTKVDLAWAAGFLEGEGCFTKGGNSSNRVCANQRQREPLTRLQAMFGGRVSSYRTGRNRGLFLWSVAGMRARGVMLTMYVFMSPWRKQQIKQGLS